MLEEVWQREEIEESPQLSSEGKGAQFWNDRCLMHFSSVHMHVLKSGLKTIWYFNNTGKWICLWSADSTRRTEVITRNKNPKSMPFTKETDLRAIACSAGIRFKRYFFKQTAWIAPEPMGHFPDYSGSWFCRRLTSPFSVGEDHIKLAGLSLWHSTLSLSSLKLVFMHSFLAH